MASATYDMRGLTIELDHSETEKMLGVLTSPAFSGPTLTAFFSVVGIAGAAVPYVVVAVVLHVTWESAVIRAADAGDGVWLSAPPPVLVGMPGVIIPWTWHTSSGFDGHADNGVMVSPMGDEISWSIARGVGDPDDCKFVLMNEVSWDKAYKLVIGPDQWWVQAPPHSSAENGIWASQLGQAEIVFHKPQFLGQWGPVSLSISNFTGLQGTDVTTFRWIKQ